MESEAMSPPRGGISGWLEWGRDELAFLGSRAARQECEQILQTLLGVSRTELYLSTAPPPLTFRRYSVQVESRKKRTPLAYTLGQTYFWEDCFEVEEGIFVPRPETECLIENFLNSRSYSKQETFRFLDLGTGSGIIAATIAKLFSKAKGVASDISEQALKVAHRNANRIGVAGRIDLICADGLSIFEKETFDVVFSNPPYVASGDWPGLEPEVRREPRAALDGGKDGLDFYRRIFSKLSCLKTGGDLWVEIGWGQAPDVRTLFEKNCFCRTLVLKDLNKIERVVAGMGFKGNG